MRCFPCMEIRKFPYFHISISIMEIHALDFRKNTLLQNSFLFFVFLWKRDMTLSLLYIDRKKSRRNDASTIALEVVQNGHQMRNFTLTIQIILWRATLWIEQLQGEEQITEISSGCTQLRLPTDKKEKNILFLTSHYSL